MGNSKLYVGNMSFKTSEDELRSAFGQFGTVSDVYIAMDKMTNRPRGFAFVTMGTPEEAKTAAEKLNGADLGGRALGTRLALNLGGIKFEDKRYEFSAWPEFKPHTPLGQLPVLEVDGQHITQSSAILRYAGRLAGLVPSDSFQQLRVDEVLSLIDELLGVPSADKPEDLKGKRETFVETKMKRNLRHIDEIIARSGSGYVSSSGLSIADLALFAAANFISIKFLDHVDPTLAGQYPHIKEALTKIQQHPKLADYFAAHPKESTIVA